MTISSRTPEGEPAVCSICDTAFTAEPSYPCGDAPCPSCGHLVWFDRDETPEVRRPFEVFPPRWSVRPAAAVARPVPDDRPRAGELAAAGRGRAVFRSLTGNVQYAAGIVAICMVAVALGWAPFVSRSFVPFCLDLCSLAVVVAFIVFIYARLAWVVGLLWARCVPRVETGGSSFGGVWDRELDG